MNRPFYHMILGCMGCLVIAWFAYSGISCSPPASTNTNEGPVSDTTVGQDATSQITDISSPTEQEPAETAPATEPSAGTDDASSKPDQPASGHLTWYKDIQPLIQKNCQRCHDQGGVGPFPLTNYEEVKSKATVVKWAVETGRMPPWGATEDPNKHCVEFADSRKLRPQDISAITTWVEAGTPLGDPKDAQPYAPTIDKLDTIDADVDIQTDYTPPTKSPDDYHCFLTNPVITDNKNKELTGFQLIPGVKGMVHHVLIYGVKSSYAATLAKQYPNKHWPCSTGALFTGSSVGGNATLLGVWVPGTDVVRFPAQTGLPMSNGDQLVLEIHYNISSLNAPQPDRTRIRLQYAKQPVRYKLQLTIQLELGINIPSGSKDHVESNTLNVPTNVRVWGMMPHMHKFGKKFSVDIQKAQATNSCMIDIPRWDYNWQQTYFFKDSQGLLLGPNDKLLMRCTFDNPTLQNIRWGDKTGDEMCLTFYFVSAP